MVSFNRLNSISMKTKNNKILIAMSGGVDSSVAAALLKEQGYQVTGVTMKIWGGDSLFKEGRHHGCYGPDEEADIEDARKVALTLEIPFHVIDLTGEYKSVVLDYFCNQYLSGLTPNPCVRCNHLIKFKALIEKASLSGIEFDYVASGHYARWNITRILNGICLKKAKILRKTSLIFYPSFLKNSLAA